MYKDKKKKPKATPGMTGTGMARDAGKAFQNRSRNIDAQIEGTYEYKDRREPNDKKKKGK